MKGASAVQTAAAPAAKSTGAIALQRQCACGQHTVSGEECQDCRKGRLTLQRRGNGNPGNGFAPPIVHEVLRSPGRPLPGNARSMMEAGLGRDFSRVRVHTDGRAAESARAVRALAYTVGHNVVFASGQFSPATASGRKLLAHELTHVAQQGAVDHVPNRIPLNNDARYESEAERAGEAVTSQGRGPRAIQAGAAPTIMRQTADAQPAAPQAAPQAAGPAGYDGCTDQQAIITARTEAAGKAANAVAVLNDLQTAAPLLDAHFHLNAAEPANQQDLSRVRSQFVRMRTALNSGVRIFCRSAPQVAMGGPRPTMPVEDACAHENAHSTSCAGGDATATVVLCEMALLGMGDGPLSKTILHEFAHIACNNDPQIHSGGRGGGEVYYDGSRLPGTTPNVLDQADSYAWFAMNAPAARTGTPGQPETQSSGGGLPGWAIALLAIGGVAVAGAAIGIGAYLSSHH